MMETDKRPIPNYCKSMKTCDNQFYEKSNNQFFIRKSFDAIQIGNIKLEGNTR